MYHAARILASSFRVETTLPRVARLIVPHLASWCTIDLLGERHALSLVAAAHIVPREEAALREQWGRYVAGLAVPEGYSGVLHSRRALALPDVPGILAAPSARDPVYLRLLADLRARAALVVPLVAHGRLLGVLTLAATRPDQRLNHDVLALAQRLADFCALAVDNARLYAAAQAELSERRRAVEALQDSDRFLHATLDALTPQIATLDAAGTIVAVNAAWHRFAEANGYADPAHGVGRNYLAVCDAAGAQAVGAAAMAHGIRAVLAGERADFTLDYPCHTPARRRWFVARVTPFQGDGQRYALVAHEETTERRLALEALQESEVRFRAIVNQSNDAIVVADDAGRLLLANPAACVLLDEPDEQHLLGRPILHYLPAARRAAARANWLALLTAGQAAGEFDVVRTDGSIRTVEYRATARISPAGTCSRSTTALNAGGPTQNWRTPSASSRRRARRSGCAWRANCMTPPCSNSWASATSWRRCNHRLPMAPRASSRTPMWLISGARCSPLSATCAP